jgi:cyclic-di-GMP phosphodiesterase, flagellum assembly factor TipF
MMDTEWVGRVNDWLEKPIRMPFTAAPPDEDNQTFLVLTQNRRGKFLPDTRVLRIAGIFAAGGAAVLWALAALRAPPGTLGVTASVLALCGLVFYGLVMRRRWEKDVERQLRKLSDYHDRLVREVARSRGDVSTLKEGLYDTAASVRDKRRAPPESPEARMIEAIAAQLGALGEKPRTGLELPPEVSKVLELEMAPPPLRPPPVSALEKALGFDTGKFSNMSVLQMIRHAVRNDAVDVFLQPVVSLPARKARMYEVLARIRAGDGVHVPAAHYMALAQKENLVPAIDNLLLLRCLQLLRGKAGRDPDVIPYMLNISAATLSDRGFMGDLVSFLSGNRLVAARLVFELPQAELEAMDKATLAVLDGLSQLGCRFAMDGVRRRRLDIEMLTARHVRFIKLDAAWLIREGGTRFGAARVARLKKHLDAAGIDLIVEKIEDEATLRTLLDYDINFGQGWLFGKPDTAIAWHAANRAA